MYSARAFRIPTRAALVGILLATSIAPVSGGSPTVTVTTTASPTSVTVDHAIGYIVKVANEGANTLNHATLTGEMQTLAGQPTNLFEYLGAYTGADLASECSQPPATAASCDFGQLPARTSAPDVTFYYRAPGLVHAGAYNFLPVVNVGEGGNDSGSASHVDTFPDPLVPIRTEVLATQQDLVRGHAILGFREFDTGINNIIIGNPHGTKVRIPTANAEVTVEDLAPNDPEVACPAEIAATCFGWGSSLSVADGGEIPGGIEVTMRWDASDLPKGMTARKLRIAHLLDIGYEQVKDACVFAGGVPTNMPCISVAPFTHRDKDIQATFFLASNRVSRGY
ncbi:MAG: hypothetical protein M3406_15700 [Chloroflexota bacterium]|nr:hypothetical protein [Chloroflexota bacterium]